MNPPTTLAPQKRIAIITGVVGLAFIVIGLKYLPAFWAAVNPPAGLDQRPAI